MKLAFAVSVLLLAGSNLFAADTHTAVPAASQNNSSSAPTYYEPVLIYFMVLTQTTDTATPVEVNNLNINADLDDDDLNVFYSLVFNFH